SDSHLAGFFSTFHSVHKNPTFEWEKYNRSRLCEILFSNVLFLHRTGIPKHYLLMHIF
ncbi:hypothetical protein ABMA28_004382, partial [Loxostege sticticalis]